MSNIEDDMYEIKKLQEFLIFYKNHGWIPNIDRTIDIEKSLQAIKNILSEREQDKARIKELEEENMEKDLEKIGIQQDTEANMKEIIEKYYTANEKCIPKQREKEMQAKIKELEEENRIFKNKNVLVNRYFKLKDNSIPKQKVKDIAKQIQEEYNKVQEQFDCIWNKKSKDNYDRYKLQELSAMQQELGFILGKFEKLLEEGE